MPERLECQSVAIVDDSGRVRISLRVHQGPHEIDAGPAIELFDEGGTMRLAARVTPAGASIDLFDDEGAIRGSLHQGPMGAAWHKE